LRGKMNIMMKKRIVKYFIWSEVEYGAGTMFLMECSAVWIINVNTVTSRLDMNRLQAFEMWICRRIMKVSWKEHRTNEGRNANCYIYVFDGKQHN